MMQDEEVLFVVKWKPTSYNLLTEEDKAICFGRRRPQIPFTPREQMIYDDIRHATDMLVFMLCRKADMPKEGLAVGGSELGDLVALSPNELEQLGLKITIGKHTLH